MLCEECKEWENPIMDCQCCPKCYREIVNQASKEEVNAIGGNERYTPLTQALDTASTDAIKILLSHPDIDVNKATCESTALHYACLRNSVALIEAICAKVIIRSQANLFNEMKYFSLMLRRTRRITSMVA